MTPAARREKSPAVDEAVFASAKKLKGLIAYQKASKRGDGLVEVKIDVLSAALQGAGLVRPPGYTSGPEPVLIALGDRAAGPTATERFAADTLETAMFGRGIQAVDADDALLKLAHPITAKTEAEPVAQAAAGGWAGLLTGGVADVARHETQSDSWRARARYSLSLYGVDRGTAPARFEADGEARDVSSFSAVAGAIGAAAQDAALRAEGLMARKHAGHATIGVLVSGYKDPVFLNQVVADLRLIEGVEGAALTSWHGFDEMALIQAYASTLTVDALAAKLINAHPKLRITAVETQDVRITIAGPRVPESEDLGREE